MDNACTSTSAHPAPHRNRVNTAMQLFALLGAPLAWSVQLVANFVIANTDCSAPVAVAVVSVRSAPLIWSLNVAAVVVAGLAAYFAYNTWRRTHVESADASHHELLDVGEGRARFLAICSLLTASLFVIATVTNTLALAITPKCGP